MFVLSCNLVSFHPTHIKCVHLHVSRPHISPVTVDCGGFPGGTVVNNLSANAGDARDVGLIPGSGRSPGV